MRKKAIISILLLSFIIGRQQVSLAQSMGFTFPEGKSKQVIPFKKYNNLIVLSIKINDEIKVNFILDTSVEHTIITEKAIGDQANLNYLKKISLGGTKDSPIYAYIASNVKLELKGGLISEYGQLVMVMEQDYFNLRATTGADIYGIIGYDIFKRFVVEVNNTNSTITLTEPKKFTAPKGYAKTPLTTSGSKAFVNTKIVFENWEEKSLELLLDIGANHAVLFNGDSSSFLIPTHNLNITIAKSFGGDINGYLGRVRNVSLGDFNFKNPIASFSSSENMYLIKDEYNDKKGAIGQDIMSRFDYVLDYHSKQIYLKKNSKFKDEFEYDMSGMSITKDNSEEGIYTVTSLIENSPAQNAGVLEGDIVQRINGDRLSKFNFSQLLSDLKSKQGKTVSVDLIRAGKSIKVSFKLYKLI